MMPTEKKSQEGLVVLRGAGGGAGSYNRLKTTEDQFLAQDTFLQYAQLEHVFVLLHYGFLLR